MSGPESMGAEALAQILRKDAALGVDIFDDGGRPVRPPPGPPVRLQPLLPPMIPPVDWRAEEEERARQRDEEDRR